MNRKALTDIAQLEDIDKASLTQPVLLFKHSTRCSISRTALDRLEREWTAQNNAGQRVFLLDLLKFPAVSNAVAARYGVVHESPQTLVIRGGRCVWNASHFGISYAGTMDALAA